MKNTWNVERDDKRKGKTRENDKPRVFLKKGFGGKKHSFAAMRECNLIKKTKKLSKIGGGLPECKKVFFFRHCFGFGGFVFFSLCFCAFVLCKIAQNGYFLHF